MTYTHRGGSFDFVPYAFGDLTRAQLSWRISDHYPLWVEFDARPGGFRSPLTPRAENGLNLSPRHPGRRAAPPPTPIKPAGRCVGDPLGAIS